MIEISHTAPRDLPALTQLFRAYAASLPIDLSYQDFAAELASLPGKYAPPDGALLIARDARARRSAASRCGRFIPPRKGRVSRKARRVGRRR